MNASRNVWLAVAALAVLVVAGVVYFNYFRDDTATTQATGVMAPQSLPDIILGEESAPVTIIEYASMTCPHCASFHTQTLPAIKEKYIDNGQVKLIMREFPFDPRAAAAAMLARCAPTDRFYPLLDVLFKRQREWSQAEDPRPVLLQITRLAGFTQESFEACLKNQQLLDNVRSIQQRAQQEYGVESTPTLFINGEKHTGALSVEELSQIIDAKL